MDGNALSLSLSLSHTHTLTFSTSLSPPTPNPPHLPHPPHSPQGRGGALLREKMVEVCAKEFVVIVDDSKIVKHLGTTGALPVEITPFCWEHTLRRIEGVESLKGKGCKATLRMDGDKPYVTDNDNYIVNLFFSDPLPSAQDVVSDCEVRLHFNVHLWSTFGCLDLLITFIVVTRRAKRAACDPERLFYICVCLQRPNMSHIRFMDNIENGSAFSARANANNEPFCLPPTTATEHRGSG